MNKNRFDPPKDDPPKDDPPKDDPKKADQEKKSREEREKELDEELEQTFPASDPPSHSVPDRDKKGKKK